MLSHREGRRIHSACVRKGESAKSSELIRDFGRSSLSCDSSCVSACFVLFCFRCEEGGCGEGPSSPEPPHMTVERVSAPAVFGLPRSQARQGVVACLLQFCTAPEQAWQGLNRVNLQAWQGQNGGYFFTPAVCVHVSRV